MEWTKESIRQWLQGVADSDGMAANVQQAVGKALVLIFERQTMTEQAANCTSQNNGRGFNGTDTDFGSSVAKKFIAYGRLSPRQTTSIAKMLRKYSGQLAEARAAQGQTMAAGAGL